MVLMDFTLNEDFNIVYFILLRFVPVGSKVLPIYSIKTRVGKLGRFGKRRRSGSGRSLNFERPRKPSIVVIPDILEFFWNPALDFVDKSLAKYMGCLLAGKTTVNKEVFNLVRIH
jgi:hypothetical protein